ncbi:ferric-chelate reductase [Sporothrix schenckii 1099-18]|uniref:ferric-chelate reductase (NADPH) n=2 Tax=Sporothrix schenckii TaxID=29908 RepID=U7PKJ7_SPOS1|nr:ferric-chelate reductase [Sporothrix schenckii 1099-18]ERS96087.1 hypothetical protein HMPREF1624_07623 [Sporothrix schenckii ATCC 58251]KJR81640.1 ferric-chelate reductase [Sporothrix schenckii 1099-18]
MDMDMPYEWLTSPVQLHSSRETNCTMTAEQCAYKSRRWVNWYIADLVYGRAAVYFFVATIAVFILGHLLSRLLPASVRRCRPWLRVLAAVRSLAYPNAARITFLQWNSPSVGVCLLGAAGAAFFAGCTLGPQPYYWPNTADAHYGDSPPLATRSGYLAMGCLPFILVFGSKANLVTAATGVAPEKLVIFHLMAAWGMFVLALLHTFPFIVYNATVPGALEANWNSSAQWLTGVVALLAQAGLTFLSLPFVRHRAYEVFKGLHFALVLVFLVFLFLHCDYTLTSWDYIIAAVALYLASLLWAVARTYLAHGLRTASLDAVSPHTLKIAVTTPDASRSASALVWRPGQHLYLRFLAGGAVHALTTHPFTICSVAGHGDAVFYVRPRGGLTGRLAAMARQRPGRSVPLFIEGPYGGVPHRWDEGFDETLVVAGGAGAGFALGLVQDWFVRRQQQQQRAGRAQTLLAVVSSRDPALRTWFVDALRAIDRNYDGGLSGVAVVLHATGEAAEAVPETVPGTAPDSVHDDAASGSDEKGAAPVEVETTKETGRSASSAAGSATASATASTATLDVQYRRGQADLPALIRAVSSAPNRHVGVAVCGPSSMAHDVAAACAAEQRRIVAGGAGASEVWLHQEAFTS